MSQPRAGDRVLLLWDGEHAYWGSIQKVLNKTAIYAIIEDPLFFLRFWNADHNEDDTYPFLSGDYVLVEDLISAVLEGGGDHYHEP